MLDTELFLAEENLSLNPVVEDDRLDRETNGANFFLGGILGWMLGSHRDSSASSLPASYVGEGGNYSEEEKNFLTEVWRFEKELRSSIERKDWFRVYLLVHLAAEAFKQDWSRFVPDNQGYAGTPKFESEIRNILQDFLGLCTKAAKLDFQNLVKDTVVSQGETAEVYFDFDRMELTIDGKILERVEKEGSNG